MSSRERAGAGVAPAVDLWAMAAELEDQFAGYKQRLAERSSAPAPDVSARAARDNGSVNAGGAGAEEEEDGGGGGDVKGRLYEAYTRRRDERLRDGCRWRARMERKEAEAKAFWAQLERIGGRAGGGGGGGGIPAASEDDGGIAGEHKAEDGREKRRSSDVVAPGRISGKKHARTRSFSFSTTKTSRPDVATPTRRALSQEPPPPSPSKRPVSASAAAAAARKDIHRARLWPTGAGVTAAKRKSFSGQHRIFVKDTSKPPRSLPRPASSGCLDDLREAATAQSYLSDQASVHDETQEASPSSTTPFAGAADVRAASPDSDCSEVVDNAADGHEAGAKNDGERDADEVIAVSPGKLGNGEITSDSDTDPSYVYVKKVDVEEDAMATTRSGTPAFSDAKPELEGEQKNGGGGGAEEESTASSDAVDAAESSTTIAGEAPARESSDESSFSGRSVGSPPNSRPSSRSSRTRAIERQLEEDAALLRKKREESAALTPPRTPARVSGTAQSPRTPARVSGAGSEAVRGFKRFLSFGKKNRSREAVTVIDCTSPSVPSLLDDDGASGEWQSSTDTSKPMMGSSTDAGSDDMDQGVSPRGCSLQSLVAASPANSELNGIASQEKSPKAHRSFFSLRPFNCGRSSFEANGM